jgi:DNA-binding IclR family transcriptional regulator
VQVANDTLPATRQVILQAVLASDGRATTTDIATATDYPTSSARKYLEELAAVRLVTRISEGQGKADRWTAGSDLLTLLDDVRRPLDATDLTRSVRVGVVGE